MTRPLIALALFLACGVLYDVALERELGNADEGCWIPQAARSWSLLRHGRFQDPFWSENDLLWGFASPPISKYLMGFGMACLGEGPEAVRPNSTFAGLPAFVPPPKTLRAGRTSSVVVGSAAIAALFLFLSRNRSRAVAVRASILLATSPLWYRACRRAMTDIHGVAMAMLVLPVFALAMTRTRAATSPAVRAAWWVGVGVLVGASVGCKLSAAGGAAGLAAWLLIREARSVDPAAGRVARLVRPLLAPALCVGAAVVVFVASYPYLWPSPVGRFLGILGRWHAVREEHAAYRPMGFEGAFRPGLPSFRALADVLLLPGGVASWALLVPLLAAGWLRRRRVSADLARVAAWAFAGPALLGGALFARAAAEMSQSWIVWAGVVGATSSALAVSGTLRRLRANETLLVFAAWSAGAAAFILPTTYIAWPRYYLPLVPACAVIAAYGFDELRHSVEALAGRWTARLVDVAAAAGVASVLAAFPRTGTANLHKVAALDLGMLPAWLQRVAVACLVAALAAALAKAGSRRSGGVASGSASPSAR